MYDTLGGEKCNIDFPSTFIVLYRTFLGSILLLTLYLVFGHKFTFQKYKKDVRCILISGIAMGMSWMFLYEAYQQIGVSISSLLYYTGPVIVMMLSPVLFKEKITMSKMIGFLLVLAGICLVNGRTAEKIRLFGILLGLLSAVIFSVTILAEVMLPLQVVGAVLVTWGAIVCEFGIAATHSSDFSVL